MLASLVTYQAPVVPLCSCLLLSVDVSYKYINLQLQAYTDLQPFVGLYRYNFVNLQLQAYTDLQPFIDLYRYPPGSSFDLTSSPVIMHLSEDPELEQEFYKTGEVLNESDFKRVSITK